MLDRALPVALEETPAHCETRQFVDVLRKYTRRLLRLLHRLTEAGGPMS